MSAHTNTRLETADGTVVAYLAPNFEVNGISDNDLTADARPRGEPMLARDLQLISFEVTAQGQFEHSDQLPSGHVTDLESIVGHSAPITAREQVNRIREFLHDRTMTADGTVAKPFHFYDGPDSYDNVAGDIDWAAGQFPPVNVSAFRPVDEPGAGRYEYTLSLQVGLTEHP